MGEANTYLEVSNIKLQGIMPVTMLDWKSRVACTLFMGGCNFRCPFCQNPELVLGPDKNPFISWNKVKNHLENKRKWLDGVVITGGEPTINNGLKDFLSMLKTMGYPTKLDTNGTRPRVLSRLIKEKLVDYIAMDVKSNFNNYSKAAGVPVDIEKIKESIHLITKSEINHEFRTTVVPGFADESNVFEIAGYLGEQNAQHYYLQQFNSTITLDPELMKLEPLKKEILLNLTEKCRRFLPTELRG